MNALRSALVEVLRDLPDAHLARIVRAAPPEALHGLVEVAWTLEDAPDEAPPRRTSAPSEAKPKKAKSAEAARGQRPPKPAATGGLKVETIERVWTALKKMGPSSGKALVDKLGLGVATVSTALTCLAEAGRVERTRDGRQTLNEAIG
jgi:hypothetical protein